MRREPLLAVIVLGAAAVQARAQQTCQVSFHCNGVSGMNVPGYGSTPSVPPYSGTQCYSDCDSCNSDMSQGMAQVNHIQSQMNAQGGPQMDWRKQCSISGCMPADCVPGQGSSAGGVDAQVMGQFQKWAKDVANHAYHAAQAYEAQQEAMAKQQAAALKERFEQLGIPQPGDPDYQGSLDGAMRSRPVDGPQIGGDTPGALGGAVEDEDSVSQKDIDGDFAPPMPPACASLPDQEQASCLAEFNKFGPDIPDKCRNVPWEQVDDCVAQAGPCTSTYNCTAETLAEAGDSKYYDYAQGLTDTLGEAILEGYGIPPRVTQYIFEAPQQVANAEIAAVDAQSKDDANRSAALTQILNERYQCRQQQDQSLCSTQIQAQLDKILAPMPTDVQGRMATYDSGDYASGGSQQYIDQSMTNHWQDAATSYVADRGTSEAIDYGMSGEEGKLEGNAAGAAEGAAANPTPVALGSAGSALSDAKLYSGGAKAVAGTAVGQLQDWRLDKAESGEDGYKNLQQSNGGDGGDQDDDNQ